MRQLSCSTHSVIRHHFNRIYWRVVWLVAAYALRGLYAH
jgi:hypothetical protein